MEVEMAQKVACDSLSLGDLDGSHTNAVTARAEGDAAENVLRAVLDATPNLAEGSVIAAGLGRWSRKLWLPMDSTNPAAASALADVCHVGSADPGTA
jgi:hypothetical protein